MPEPTGDLSSVMRKVAALLANADDPATPPAAAETYRSKADALMFKYKIDSLTPQAGKPAAKPAIKWVTIWVSRLTSEWAHFYIGIAQAVLAHNDCRYAVEYERNEEDGYTWAVLHVVGLTSDVEYSELLIANATLGFQRRLEPKPEPGEPFPAACLRMRQGGMERKRIAMLLLGTWNTENEMKSKNRKVTAAIKEEAERIGQPQLAQELLGRGTNIKTYRTSYANSFYWTLTTRIRQHRFDAAQEEVALVLAGAKDIVDEAYYEKYPSRRPKATVESSAPKQAECAKCKAAKSGYCKEHAWMKPSNARARHTPYSSAGNRAGANAARSVDLGGVGQGRVGQGSDRPAIG